LTEAQNAAKFQGCLGLRFPLIDAQTAPSGVDLQFETSVPEYTDMAMPATQIRRGMVLVFEGDPCRVVEFRHHTPGNLRAMVQAKLKNLRTGNSFEHRFRAADTIEKASMETHDLEFMYQGGNTYHFMNTENYDQMEIEDEVLGDNAQWMQSGMKIQAEYYNGRVIGIQLPNSMVLEVVDTAPVMKTATKTASTKPAKLENGVTVNVPEFVNTGEKVRVNPNTGEYMDRSK
jgi:elongation factor P